MEDCYFYAHKQVHHPKIEKDSSLPLQASYALSCRINLLTKYAMPALFNLFKSYGSRHLLPSLHLRIITLFVLGSKSPCLLCPETTITLTQIKFDPKQSSHLIDICQNI